MFGLGVCGVGFVVVFTFGFLVRWFCGVVVVVLVLVCCLELFCLVGFVTICYGVVVCFWFALGFAVGFGLVCCWVAGSLLAAYLCFGVVVLLRCGFGLDSAVCSWFSLGVWVLGDFGGCGRLLRLLRGADLLLERLLRFGCLGRVLGVWDSWGFV